MEEKDSQVHNSSGDADSDDSKTEEVDVVDKLINLVEQVLKNQSESAAALQKILIAQRDELKNITDNIEQLESHIFDVLKEISDVADKISTLEEKLIEQDVRQQNMRIRKHDPFGFQPRKNGNL